MIRIFKITDIRTDKATSLQFDEDDHAMRVEIDVTNHGVIVNTWWENDTRSLKYMGDGKVYEGVKHD